MEDYITSFSEMITGDQTHHLVLEVLLIVWVLWLISKKNNRQELKLTESEKDALVRDFEPEPLVTDVPASHYSLKPRVVRGKVGTYVNVDGVECLNFATHNYLGFIGNKTIEEKAMKSIEKYGVGSCGPRGFYGTSEVHLDLEKRLAEFMGAEDAVVYSYAFATMASAIPAYSKKGDIVFVDEKVNFAIQKGLDASRSVIKYFKHNDMEDLHRILEETRQADLKNVKKALRSRRFLIVEGIYANTGRVCPLPQLIQLQKKYKLRIFIDESISFGVLGKTGRGVTEHFNIPTSEVDLVMASLENSLASIGGFCVGSAYIVDHQRLSGLGYCFSASLPPLLVIAAMEALKSIDEQPELLHKLADACHAMHDRLNTSSIITKHFVVSGDRESPVHLLVLRDGTTSPDINKQAVISDFIESCLHEGKAVSRAARLEEADKATPTACLRITTSASHSKDDISSLVKTLESTCCTRFSSAYSDT